MKRTSGFVPTLLASLVGWGIFLIYLLAAMTRIPAVTQRLPDYTGFFFCLVFYLLALVPVLMVTGTLGVRRKQLRPIWVGLIVVLFVAVNYGLLWLVRPFFATGYPLG